MAQQQTKRKFSVYGGHIGFIVPAFMSPQERLYL